MQHNGVAKRKHIFINLKIKDSICKEFTNRAYERDLEYSEYIKRLMEIEDSKAFFVDSAFARPLTNILKQVRQQAENEQEEEKRQSFKW